MQQMFAINENYCTLQYVAWGYSWSCW